MSDREHLKDEMSHVRSASLRNGYNKEQIDNTIKTAFRKQEGVHEDKENNKDERSKK